MRNPRTFFHPLAIGAPEPVRDVPIKPSRMIHFFDPSNPKMVAKVGDMARQADIVLGNLEDAVAADKKLDATSAARRCGPASTASTARGASTT